MEPGTPALARPYLREFVEFGQTRDGACASTLDRISPFRGDVVR